MTALAILGLAERGNAQSTTVVITLWSEPDSLDPAITTVNGGRSTVKNIYESLVDLEKGSVEPKPALATAWQISRDGLVYTFTLRKGVAFTDGSQAHQEPRAALGQAALIAGRHHGGVEEGGRFMGVFHGEVCPDEAPASRRIGGR
jgi:ABC-type oligopeptide transport system substrate-binding subunit